MLTRKYLLKVFSVQRMYALYVLYLTYFRKI